MSAHRQMLTFAPESGNMLGGTIVNVTGPCFDKTKRITCRYVDVINSKLMRLLKPETLPVGEFHERRFNTIKVPGAVIDENRATCVMPPIYAAGYVDLFVEVDGSNDLLWKGKFLVETPFTAPELVSFPENDPYEKYPTKISIRWDYKNLTLDQNTPVSISLWGYRENTITPELVYLESLAVSHNNLEKLIKCEHATEVCLFSPCSYRFQTQENMSSILQNSNGSLRTGSGQEILKLV